MAVAHVKESRAYRTTEQKQVKETFGASKTKRYHEAKTSAVPGPGQYDVTLASDAPAWRLPQSRGYAPAPSPSSAVPGPGTYNVKGQMLVTAGGMMPIKAGGGPQARPTSAKRSDVFMRNQRAYGLKSGKSQEGGGGGPGMPERPKLFRVVTECTLQDMPLIPDTGGGGGGVRVRPLALCDENELGEFDEEEEEEEERAEGLILAAAHKVQAWVGRFLSSRMDGPKRQSRFSLGMGGRKRSVAVARVPEPYNPRVSLGGR